METLTKEELAVLHNLAEAERTRAMIAGDSRATAKLAGLREKLRKMHEEART